MSKCMVRHWFGSNGKSNYFFLGFLMTPNPCSIHGTSYVHLTNRLFCQPNLVHGCLRKSFYHDIGILLDLKIGEKEKKCISVAIKYKIIRYLINNTAYMKPHKQHYRIIRYRDRMTICENLYFHIISRYFHSIFSSKISLLIGY